jgi:hypothetical protein
MALPWLSAAPGRGDSGAGFGFWFQVVCLFFKAWSLSESGTGTGTVGRAFARPARAFVLNRDRGPSAGSSRREHLGLLGMAASR